MSETVKHDIHISGRQEIKISGVQKVLSFDEGNVTANTIMGRLIITGNNLSVGGFDEKRGELFLTGEIGGLRYNQKKFNNMLKNVRKKGKI